MAAERSTSYFAADAAASCVRGPGPRVERAGRQPRTCRDRGSPERYSDPGSPSRVRGLPVPRAVPVRRPIRRSGHAPERQVPRAHQRRPRIVWLRLDDAGQRVGVSRAPPGRGARRDAGARRRDCATSPRDCDDKGHPIDLFRVLEPAVSAAPPLTSPRAQALPVPDSQALHAGGRERLRRRAFTTPTARRSA